MPTTNLRGILAMLAAVTTFAVMDVLLKNAGGALPCDAGNVSARHCFDAAAARSECSIRALARPCRQALAAAPAAYLLHFITEAFRLAPPSVVAPLEYTALAWGVFFDWLLWATAPGLRMLTGAFIIVASGIYVINHARFAGAALQQQH